MKVSIVIPAYNEEKYIASTIEAVLAQNYPDFEVIVVDNASTDKTSEIAANYPVTVVYEARKGLLWAREAGRKHATGEIIVNTDADCTPDPEWLTRGVSYFTSYSIVAVTGPVHYFDAGPVFRHVTSFIQTTFYPFFSKLFQLFRIGAVLIGGNNFIRASVLKTVGGYNTAIEFYGEDTDTAKRLMKHGKVAFKSRVVTKTSSRRFVAQGTWETSFLYLFNFIWVTFFRSTQRRLKLRAKNLFSGRVK
jgi:glycosyltransferase involved in cell wall biosynthesis